MAVELSKTTSHFKFIELDSTILIGDVPFVAGQYIVASDGKAYYDPSSGSAVADRIELSPDLTGFVTKVAGNGMVKGFNVSQQSDGNIQLKITYTDSSTGQEAYLTQTMAISQTVAEDSKSLVSSAAIYEAIQAAITTATNKAAAVLFEVDVTSDDTTALATITKMKQGDIAVCVKTINGDKKQRTAYMYDNKVWKALDGNYSADNVYFADDLITTSAVGNITLSGGQATIAASGKNLTDVWQSIFVKETNTGLLKTQPSAKFSGNTLKYIQVGSSSSETVTMSMADDGEYLYGYTTQAGSAGASAKNIVNNKTTGVKVDATAPFALSYQIGSGTATAVTATGDNKNTFTVNSGVQTVKTSAKITGTMKHGAGYTPVSNLKKMYPAQAISAGTKNVASFEIFRWYIPMFHGFKLSGSTIATPNNLTEANVKSLSKDIDATAYNQTKRTSDAASGSWMQYFIAVPSAYNWNITGAKDSNNLTLDIKRGNKVSVTLGTASVEYQIWYINNAAPYDTKNIVITW